MRWPWRRRATVNLLLRIENVYPATGSHVVRGKLVRVPVPPAEDATADRRAWRSRYIFPATGAGRTKGPANYTVTVLQSSDKVAVPRGTVWNFTVRDDAR